MKNSIICGDAMVEKTSKGARMKYSAAYSTGRELSYIFVAKIFIQ